MALDPIVQQLVDARVRAGRTQRDVAFFAGISQATLCDAENGRCEPRLGTLRKWAAALDLEPALVDKPKPTGGWDLVDFSTGQVA